MMKIKISSLAFAFFFLVSTNLFGQAREWVTVKTFQMGGGPESFRYGHRTDPSPGPSVLEIDSFGNGFVLDEVKNRIVQLDSDWNYVRQFSGLFLPGFPTSGFRVFPAGFIGDGRGVFIDRIEDGEYQKTVKILFDGTAYASRISRLLDYFVHENQVFIRFDDGEWVAFENPGDNVAQNIRNMITGPRAITLLQTALAAKGPGYSLDAQQNIVNNGRIVTFIYSRFLDFWKNRPRSPAPNVSLQYPAEHYLSRNVIFRGQDVNGYTYWSFGVTNILIFNAEGHLIERFYFDSSVIPTTAAFHPSGDIYGIGYTPQQVFIYKMPRTW